MNDDHHDLFKIEKGKKRFTYIKVIKSLAAHVEMPVGVVSGLSPGPIFAVTGGLFPMEYDGVEAASRLYHLIDPKQLSGTLIVVPVVNMPCLQFRTPWFSLNQSIGPVDGLNINSVFPGNPDGSATEVLAHRLFHDIIVKSDYHVDLRGGDRNESHLAHTIFLRTGREIDKKCEEMAKVFGLEYVLPGTREITHTGKGTLIYEAVTHDVASIISESGLGYRTQPLEECVMLHVEGVRNILKHTGMLEGTPVRPKNQRFLDMTWNRIKAPVSGIFHAIADQGDLVKKGTMLGRITDIDGSELSRILSPIDGVVHCMYPRRLVSSGDSLYTLLQIAEPTGW